MSTIPRDSSTKTDEAIRVETPGRGVVFLAAKRCVQALVTLWILPRLLFYYVGRILLGRKAFGAASESIARIPGLRGVYCRQAFYRKTLAHCGQDVYIGWQSVFSMTEAVLGDRVYIGRFCSLGYARLGDEVMLADGVQILSGGHEHGAADAENRTMREQTQTYHPVQIGRGAWIGTGAIIMADVGEGAIIGAGAVVNKPIPDRCVAVGVPARVVKTSAM